MSTQNWLILAKFAKRRLSNHNDIWKQKILKLFCKQANKSQDRFNYATSENFTVWLLELGHLEADYPTTMFFENKDSQVVLQTHQ